MKHFEGRFILYFKVVNKLLINIAYFGLVLLSAYH